MTCELIGSITEGQLLATCKQTDRVISNVS